MFFIIETKAEAPLLPLLRLSSVAGPFFVAGMGTAFAFIPISIGALTGVTERDAGVASGLRRAFASQIRAITR